MKSLKCERRYLIFKKKNPKSDNMHTSHTFLKLSLKKVTVNECRLLDDLLKMTYIWRTLFYLACSSSE